MAFAKVSAITLSAVVGTGVAQAHPLVDCSTRQLCVGETCSQYTQSSSFCHQALNASPKKTFSHAPHFSLGLVSKGVVEASVYEDASCQKHTGLMLVRERSDEPCTLDFVSWRPHRTSRRGDRHADITRRHSKGNGFSRQARAPGVQNETAGGINPPTTPPPLTSPAVGPIVDTTAASTTAEFEASEEPESETSTPSTKTTTAPPPTTTATTASDVPTTATITTPPSPPTFTSSPALPSASTSEGSSAVVTTTTGADKPTTSQVQPTESTQGGSTTSQSKPTSTGKPTSSASSSTSTHTTTSGAPPPPTLDGSLDTGLIAGAVVGGLAGLALVAAGVLFFCRRRSKTTGVCFQPRDGKNHSAAKIADAGLGLSTLQGVKGKPDPTISPPLATTGIAAAAVGSPMETSIKSHYQHPPPSPPSSLLALDAQQQTSVLAFVQMPSNASTITAGGFSQQTYSYGSGAAWAIAQRPLPLPPAPYPGHRPQTAEAIQSARGGGVAVVPENLIKMQLLGEGEFGSVFQGVLREGVSWCPVAIKELKRDAPVDPSVFYREAALMMTLKHPNIVTFLGTTPSQPFSIVMELMPLGDLRMYLRKRKSTGRRTTVAERMWFAFQIARGMHYLASRGIAHRDLAARNCMLGEPTADSFGYPVLKVSDFGLSRETNENNYYRMGNAGKLPVAWMAPESLRTLMFSSATDVWSYAVTLWELFSDCDTAPYAGWNVATLVADLELGKRLEQPRNCPRNLYELMLECWCVEPTQRPCFSELACYAADMFIPYSDESLVRVVGPDGDITFERQPQYESIDHRAVGSDGAYISNTSVGGYMLPQS